MYGATLSEIGPVKVELAEWPSPRKLWHRQLVLSDQLTQNVGSRSGGGGAVRVRRKLCDHSPRGRSTVEDWRRREYGRGSSRRSLPEEGSASRAETRCR